VRRPTTAPPVGGSFLRLSSRWGWFQKEGAGVSDGPKKGTP